MNKTEFTKEEINLCGRIARKYRIPFEYGACFNAELNEVEFVDKESYFQKLSILQLDSKSFPLWTISDCLEFLRGEGYLVRLVEYEHYGGVKTITCYCHGHKTKGAFSKQGNKDEEACLKAVLAVLEEKR